MTEHKHWFIAIDSDDPEEDEKLGGTFFQCVHVDCNEFKVVKWEDQEDEEE